jgi:hypothetical protein
VEVSGTRHRQPSSFMEVPTPSLLNDGNCVEISSTTFSCVTSQADAPSFQPVYCSHNERIPKKRGRPKLSSASNEHQKQLQQKYQISEKQFPSQLNSVSASNSNSHSNLSSASNLNVAASSDFVSSNSNLFQQSRVKRHIETAATFQVNLLIIFSLSN